MAKSLAVSRGFPEPFELKPELITFDCAQTLLDVRWSLGPYAVECARHAGLELDEAAAALYSQLYRPRHGYYLELNLTRDSERCEAFWQELSRDWLKELGHDPDVWHAKLDRASNLIGFSGESEFFRAYEDVRPALERLRALGARLAVISNWDYSLHKILRALGLHDRFELVVASLEEGYEKPDPRIFLQTLKKLGVEPGNAAHVGDNPIDDLQGARKVGMRGVLVDRSRKSPASPPYVASLLDLPGALGWKD